MPELPEVETTRRGLAPHLHGPPRHRRHLAPAGSALADSAGDFRAAAGPAHPRYAPPRQIPAARYRARQRPAAPGHVGQPARAARRHAGHARTTTWTWRWTRARCFASTTRAASAACCGNRRAAPTSCCSNLGPEPLSDDFDGDYLFERSRGRSASIKTFLMDQSIVVGVGNIYVAESLFRAGIAPSRQAGRVSRERYGATGRGGEGHPGPRHPARRHHPARFHQPGRRARATSNRNCSSTGARAKPAGAAGGACCRVAARQTGPRSGAPTASGDRRSTHGTTCT